MSRPAGLPKTGGRVRGTPNKKSSDLLRRLKRLGCDPLEGLARIAVDPQTEVALKIRCMSELAQYVYPKRKAVDMTADSSEFKVTVEHIGATSRPYSLDGIPVPAEFREAKSET